MDDESFDALQAKLRERSTKLEGKYLYSVLMRVSGYVTYRVRADSEEEAKDRAWDLFDEAANPFEDGTTCTGEIKARKVDEPPKPTAEKP